MKGCLDEHNRKYEDNNNSIDLNDKLIPLSFDAIKLNEGCFVNNVEVVASLTKILELKMGGLFVFGAPSGAGKTTYLNAALKIFLQTHPERLVFYISGLTPKVIEENLKIPAGRLFSDFLPDGSIIVIDQDDEKNSELSGSITFLLTQFATQSRNSRTFHVLIAVSNPARF
jgi:energy-coupling factor transporter ATP-binding protein EcfA2